MARAVVVAVTLGLVVEAVVGDVWEVVGDFLVVDVDAGVDGVACAVVEAVTLGLVVRAAVGDVLAVDVDEGVVVVVACVGDVVDAVVEAVVADDVMGALEAVFKIIKYF